MHRVITLWMHLSVGLAVAFASGPSAWAHVAGPEQLVTAPLPVPASRLWVSLSADTDATGEWQLGADGRIAPTATVDPRFWVDLVPHAVSDTVEPRRGQPLVFAAMGWTTVVGPPDDALLPSAAFGGPSGFTLTLWYRTLPNTDGVAGWNPLIAVGDDSDEPWRLALVLDHGVPVVALRHVAGELFGDATSVPQVGSTHSIDDGLWHHVALRVAREACDDGVTPMACPSVADAGGPVQPARMSLYVDGELRGEVATDVHLELDRLLVGRLPTPEEVYTQPNFKGLALETVAYLDDVVAFDAPLAEAEIAGMMAWGKAGYGSQFPLTPPETAPFDEAVDVYVGHENLGPPELFGRRASEVG